MTLVNDNSSVMKETIATKFARLKPRTHRLVNDEALERRLSVPELIEASIELWTKSTEVSRQASIVRVLRRKKKALAAMNKS